MENLATEYERPYEAFNAVFQRIETKLKLSPEMKPEERPGFFSVLFLRKDKDYFRKMESYYRYIGETNALQTVCKEMVDAVTDARQKLNTIRLRRELLYSQLADVQRGYSDTNVVLELVTQLKDTLKSHRALIEIGRPSDILPTNSAYSEMQHLFIPARQN